MGLGVRRGRRADRPDQKRCEIVAKTLFDSFAKRPMKSLTGCLECRPFRGGSGCRHRPFGRRRSTAPGPAHENFEERRESDFLAAGQPDSAILQGLM